MRQLIYALPFLLLAEFSQAGIFGYGADKTVFVKYSFAVASANESTSTIVIDKSDTTNWPHTNSNHIAITGIDLDVDKVAAATATIKLGVVNFVDATNGSITWFWARNYGLNVSNTETKVSEMYYPLAIKTKVNLVSGGADGTTPFLISDDTVSNSTTFQNDVLLSSVSGSQIAPDEGDIVMQVISDSSNALTVDLHLWYYTDRR